LELVRRAQAGDREAFGMLVERHATDIYRLAAAIVGEFDARDVTQETFVQAWTKVGTLHEPAAFGPWLRRMCVNRCRNWLRTSRRRPSASLDRDSALAGSLRDPGHDFRGAVEARATLEPAFERLSSDQRAVLALHYSMGYSIAESASLLDIRVGTAKSRLNAGLNALRRAVGAPERDATVETAS
jgi:RNA polymerase sigma factor (sigma-70 family)